MTTTAVATTATRDEVLASETPELRHYTAVLDPAPHRHLKVLSPTNGLGYALSEVTGLVFQLRVLGKARRHMVRVELVPAVDTGDAYGTLSFDRANGHVAGYVNEALANR
jgi:hypothetical protein